MKKLVISCATFLLILFLTLAFSAMAPKGPAYSWEVLSHDFGKIKKDQPVTIEFHFTNAGDAPLAIKEAKASCGCTVAAFSKDPVAPAGKGFVKLTFNAANVGKFTKSVTVLSNVSGTPASISISGEVVE